MTDKVINMEFNDGQKRDVELFGPPQDPSWHSVIIEGRKMPNFFIREHDGLFEVLFDNRWIYQFPEKWVARIAVTMAANALAVGRGYAYLGAENKDSPFARISVGIDL